MAPATATTEPLTRALILPHRWVGTPEAADILGLHPNTLSGLRTRGTGPKYSKRLGRVRYYTGDIETWLREGERTSTSEEKK